MQRAHAIANGVFVAATNRIGAEGDLHFWGRSFVARPDGKSAAEAADAEEVLVVDCDLSQVDAARSLALLPRPADRRLRRPHAAVAGRRRDA